MEGRISFWGYKEQEWNLILPEHDDDDDEQYKTSLVELHFEKKNVFVFQVLFL